VRRATSASLALACLLACGLGVILWQRSAFISPRPTAIMTDRNGAFMAQLGGGPLGYGYWPVNPVPARVADAILGLEDQRFWQHPGVDPLAVLRAMREDLAAGRQVSGASTLAMQVARMQHPAARTLAAKLMEAATGAKRCWRSTSCWRRSARTATASPTPRRGISTARCRI
jgi:penicillin-binding protein 1C